MEASRNGELEAKSLLDQEINIFAIYLLLLHNQVLSIPQLPQVNNYIKVGVGGGGYTVKDSSVIC